MRIRIKTRIVSGFLLRNRNVRGIFLFHNNIFRRIKPVPEAMFRQI